MDLRNSGYIFCILENFWKGAPEGPISRYSILILSISSLYTLLSLSIISLYARPADFLHSRFFSTRRSSIYFYLFLPFYLRLYTIVSVSFSFFIYRPLSFSFLLCLSLSLFLYIGFRLAFLFFGGWVLFIVFLSFLMSTST